nr:MAG TPA: hypothetical protein [Bacteriophage sp.]
MKVDANQQSHPGNNTVAGLTFKRILCLCCFVVR